MVASKYVKPKEAAAKRAVRRPSTKPVLAECTRSKRIWHAWRLRVLQGFFKAELVGGRARE